MDLWSSEPLNLLSVYHSQTSHPFIIWCNIFKHPMSDSHLDFLGHAFRKIREIYGILREAFQYKVGGYHSRGCFKTLHQYRHLQKESYAMTLPDLGHAVVINNLATQLPETVPGVETLESTLETVGFKVKSYKDFSVQVKTLL